MKKKVKILKVKNPIKCRIVRRINKFVVEVQVDNKAYRAYINNTGRLKDYIVNGKVGFCILRKGKKTNYRLFSVSEDSLGVIIDTQLQMNVFEKLVKNRLIPWLKDCTIVSRNVKLGNSVIDYLLECEGKKVYLEIKSAVMKYNSYATYPDCLSLRGRKHVRELISHVRSGGRAIILFISALPDVRSFTPNCLVDQKLCELVKEAHNAGVKVKSIGIHYNPSDSFIYLFNPDLPVVFLDRGMLIRKLIALGVKEFNKYRSPTAKATLVSIGNDSFTVRFSGIFCRTCGFYDYFDDFRIFLEEVGLETRIKNVREIPTGAIVDFEVSR